MIGFTVMSRSNSQLSVPNLTQQFRNPSYNWDINPKLAPRALVDNVLRKSRGSSSPPMAGDSPKPPRHRRARNDQQKYPTPRQSPSPENYDLPGARCSAKDVGLRGSRSQITIDGPNARPMQIGRRGRLYVLSRHLKNFSDEAKIVEEASTKQGEEFDSHVEHVKKYCEKRTLDQIWTQYINLEKESRDCLAAKFITLGCIMDGLERWLLSWNADDHEVRRIADTLRESTNKIRKLMKRAGDSREDFQSLIHELEKAANAANTESAENYPVFNPGDLNATVEEDS